jgi:predicted  nucleic acid-binding Zn-ribbon protein
LSNAITALADRVTALETSTNQLNIKYINLTSDLDALSTKVNAIKQKLII